MSLLQTIKTTLLQARIRKDETTKGVLSVVVGEADTLQYSKSQKGKDLTDKQVVGIIQKIIQGNKESLEKAPDHEQAPKLLEEIETLEGFLPEMWCKAQIEQALIADESTLEQIRQAGNSGQATGMAMKFLKSQKAPVNGGDVAEVVKALRDETV